MQYSNECKFANSYTRAYILGMDSSPLAIASRLNEAMQTARPPIKAQSDLSDKSGVPQPTISRILKGKGKKGPETDTLKKLAAACGVNFNWLNEGIGAKCISQIIAPLELQKNNFLFQENEHRPIEPSQLAELIFIFFELPEKGRDVMMRAAKSTKRRFLYQVNSDQHQQ